MKTIAALLRGSTEKPSDEEMVSSINGRLQYVTKGKNPLVDGEAALALVEFYALTMKPMNRHEWHVASTEVFAQSFGRDLKRAIVECSYQILRKK